MKTIKLTLDISWKNIGYCLALTDDGDTNKLFYDNVDLQSYGKTRLEHLQCLFYFLQSIIQSNIGSEAYKYQIVFETPKTAFKGAIAFAKQKEMLGMIKANLFNVNKNVEYIEIQANQWFKYLDLKKDLGKQKTIEFLKNKNLDIDNDNTADAICMMLCFDEIWKNNKIEKLQ